jgi:hypothetical protein
MELTVGIPRRITEWSTASSWTSVARWISSTTAASVSPSAEGRPPTSLQRRRRLGRNIFPRTWRRYSLISSTRSKSATTMRRNSSTTRSSRSEIGA